MGHYDLNRDIPSRAEIELRHQAYRAKRAKQLRDEITEEEIRTYLVELHECPDDGPYALCLERHVKDVMYDSDTFETAQDLADQGVYDDVYDALPMPDRGSQLKQMCYDEGWVRQRLGSHPLTDAGINVMLDGEIERTNDPTWDEERARKWHEHA